MSGHPIEPEELMAYLDGELPVERASAAAEHLARCRDCQAVAADLQSVSRKLMAWQVETSDVSVRPAAPVVPIKRTWFGWRRIAPWALAACGVVLMLIVATPKYQRVSPTFQKFADEPAPAAPQALLRSVNGKPEPDATPTEPRIIRTAQISLTARDFEKARAALESALRQQGGHVGQMNITSPTGGGRSLQASLRVPTAHLDALMAQVRALGHVDSESQQGEEVTQQWVDLEARIANSRVAEQRLQELLRQRPGKVSEVLEVEKEAIRVRGEIERMEAERKQLADRVQFATLNVTIQEDYQATVQTSPTSAFGRLRNSAVEGWGNLIDGLIGACQFLLAYGPALILWTAILFFPARYLWRKLRAVR